MFWIVHRPMRIGDLSNRAGVTPRTVRHYESLGLLPPPRREGGGQYRYGEETVARLIKIDQLKALGLGLDEIASVIDLYFTDGDAAQPKVAVLSILRRHLHEAETKSAALEQFCVDLRGHIHRFEAWLAQNGQNIRTDDHE